MKLKNRIRSFMRDESGVMVTTEALFLYPFTIFVIFTMIYVSLYFFQAMTLQSYAQKIAVVAAREIAYPGYIDLQGGSSNVVAVFGTNAIDWESGANISISNQAHNKKINAYRYILSGIGDNSNILSDQQKISLQSAAKSMVKEQSILAGSDPIITIKSSNYFISQSVSVTITQDIQILGFVETLGFKGTELNATAYASANDPDEFVRNVDLVFSVGEVLAEKLGINGGKMADIINKVKSVLNSFNVQ